MDPNVSCDYSTYEKFCILDSIIYWYLSYIFCDATCRSEGGMNKAASNKLLLVA